MPYLVDGHNLIPRIPGLSLADLEDEQALIDLLGRFANLKRTQVEVYFDQAPPSWAGTQAYGRVRSHFIRQGTTADQAIITRLQRLGRSAQNWITVTSDREIRAEARALHSPVLTSAEFADRIQEALAGGQAGSGKGEDPEISQGEVDYWLEQFRGGEKGTGAGS